MLSTAWKALLAASAAATQPTNPVRRFNSLPSLPRLSSMPFGGAALARDFDSALQLFQAALGHFRAALGYYVLDGWVTEHINVLMDLSNLYR